MVSMNIKNNIVIRKNDIVTSIRSFIDVDSTVHIPPYVYVCFETTRLA